MVTLSFGHFCFRPECVIILGVQGLHGLMFMILISHMFAFFKRLISAKPECSRAYVSVKISDTTPLGSVLA